MLRTCPTSRRLFLLLLATVSPALAACEADDDPAGPELEAPSLTGTWTGRLDGLNQAVSPRLNLR